MKYKVGQVLYMTNPKSLKIIPVQVVEEVTRTTLNGVEKTHINAITGELFGNVDTLRSTMIERATVSIEKMITVASQLAAEEYVTNEKIVNTDDADQNEAGVQVEANNDIITVDLGNGVKAKMKTTELNKVANQ